MKSVGTQAFGVKLPIIRENDDLTKIIIDTLNKDIENEEYVIEDNDIFGITESLVGRAFGLYCSVDDIVVWLRNHFNNKMDHAIVFNPIFSRNRFSLIFRAIARAFNNVTIICDDVDEVGNEIEHDITKVHYIDFYHEICREENCGFSWDNISELYRSDYVNTLKDTPFIDCTLHPNLYIYPPMITKFTNSTCLQNIQPKNNSEWGLLGSNKVGEELLKLYPDSRFQVFVEYLRDKICKTFGPKNVDVMIYGDGCFKDADSGIWEFADPVVAPAYTEGLLGGPAELKLKYLADEEFKNLSGKDLDEAVKNRISKKKVEQGTMETQGTTPRRYVNLLGSLMDLISGSGDKGTPLVIVKNYFTNYAE